MALVLLSASVLLSLGLLHQLAGACIGKTSRRQLATAALLLAMVVALMSLTLQRAERRAWPRASGQEKNIAGSALAQTCDA